MKPNELTKLVHLCFAPWPHITPNEYLFAAYELALSDYLAIECFEAVKECLTEPLRQFPPTPPNIIKAILEARRRIALNERAAAIIEYQKARNAEPELPPDQRRELVAQAYEGLSPKAQAILDVVLKPGMRS